MTVPKHSGQVVRWVESVTVGPSWVVSNGVGADASRIPHRDQEQAYGHYVGLPSNQQLAGYFHLDNAGHELVNVRRDTHNKLGFALQLTTVRFLGTFLAEPTAVPANVVAHYDREISLASP